MNLESLALYDRSARKRATNLSVNSDLLEKARALDLNLSKALEEKLVEVLEEQRRRDWLRDNAAAIDAYNDRIEAEGSFGDRMRRF
jgi:antitoxin CcdA